MSTPFLSLNPAHFTGILDSHVISNDSNNPPDGSDCVYRLSNSWRSIDPNHPLTVNGFTTLRTDVMLLAGLGLMGFMVRRQRGRRPPA